MLRFSHVLCSEGNGTLRNDSQIICNLLYPWIFLWKDDSVLLLLASRFPALCGFSHMHLTANKHVVLPLLVLVSLL